MIKNTWKSLPPSRHTMISDKPIITCRVAFLNTSILGDDIIGATTVNGVYTRTFVYNLGGALASNIHFVAFVVDAAGNALNSRDASTSVTQTFEVE